MTDDAPVVEGEEYEGMNPLHEEWASGEIEGRDYRVLRSMTGPNVIVSIESVDGDGREKVAFSIQDMVPAAHFATIEEDGGESER